MFTQSCVTNINNGIVYYTYLLFDDARRRSMRWKCNKPVDHLERAVGHWYGQLGSLLWASFARKMTWRWKRKGERETFCLCIGERERERESRWEGITVITRHVLFLFSTRHGRRARAQRIPSRQRPLTPHLPGQRLSKTLDSLSLSLSLLLSLCGIYSKTTTIVKFSSLPIKFDRLKPTKLLLPLCVCPSTASQ